jgi:hypothetical protein
LSTLMSEIPLDSPAAAQRLRRMAAAVRVSFMWWGVHRTLTAEQKEEVSQACGADLKFLTAGKKIIDVKHEAFRRLTSLRSRIASYWRGLTLPYVEAGIRLIKQSDIESFNHTMEGFRSELNEAEANLNALFGQIKSDARRRLGKLFNPNDYPESIHGMFNVVWEFPSVEPPEYLMRLNPEIYQQEQERIARRFEEAVQLAEQAFIGEFAKFVSHLTERLGAKDDGDKKIFRDSAVSNLMEFFERFKQLNVRSNAQLDDLVKQAQTIVQGVKAQELRDNVQLRQHVATQLSSVQSVLDGMLIDRPRRRIIRPGANGDGHATGH